MCLLVVETTVQFAAFIELGMCAFICGITVLEYDYFCSIFNCAKAVSDDQYCFSHYQLV